MNPTDFGDPDLSLRATGKLVFMIQSETSWQLKDGLPWHWLLIFKVPKRQILQILVIIWPAGGARGKANVLIVVPLKYVCFCK